MFVIEITGRCDIEQGVLQPFICRLEDDQIYFAKGSNSGVPGLIKEWIAANLAEEFGLRTPQRCIAYLDPTLKPLVHSDWQKDLEYENLFASKSVAPCETVTISDIKHIPIEHQRDVFMFDYWIDNNDRNLGETAGNVNLLFQPGEQVMYVIDFNLAFGDHCVPAEMTTHVFRKAITEHPVDLADRSMYSARFDHCLQKLDEFIREIPSEWIECSPTANSVISSIKERLTRHNDDRFWGALT